MAKTLTDIIDDIPHQYLRLRDADAAADACDPHRPDIALWGAKDDDKPANVTVAVNALWGQPTRFIDMSPCEARKLARLLTYMAGAVENAATGEMQSRKTASEHAQGLS